MREQKTRYGVLAMVMVAGMIGAVAALDSIPTLGLFGMVVLFLACSAGLLFCLMKLEVMEFQKGTFWYELSMQVNAPKHRTGVQRRYTQTNTVARSAVMAK
ncbi:MAG: hypothetical protein II301_04495 [Peptococcaceae bacterium]|nr:hypothetical protein [Peptococcaceae bacterium]MBQ5708118.1 hypothetical protein [Peptococcaceae bacterium]